ncbi:uncharacterized protein STEHIDRAFT_121233 [Stereum hirsutum FP-91666 SS1]|uniref:uncharacterized protein n=1 Tax=Stereum hirsutum (strain FP-91666) TaxID=721885 RepID=UPI000440FA71|nr:uncharacterized protein STEHIDRAFT_121233 [Stereum hirsutum FP-91666 SS1]EIM87649.1 hypothetical protein STEHIDRAFT_121233 [Stereum hirsutum FP-91666 SS1]
MVRIMYASCSMLGFFRRYVITGQGGQSWRFWMKDNENGTCQNDATYQVTAE